jgi:formyl-CoA transferase
MFPEFEHPTQGRVRQLGMPIKLSDTPATFRSFSPTLGQHTDAILKGLGYTKKQIDEMRKAGAIK